MNYKVLFLILFTLTHLYQLVLNVVQHRSANHPTPANVADVYDDATYQKWRAYHGEKSRLDILRTGVSWVLTMALLLSNAYAWAAGLFRRRRPLPSIRSGISSSSWCWARC